MKNYLIFLLSTLKTENQINREMLEEFILGGVIGIVLGSFVMILRKKQGKDTPS